MKALRRIFVLVAVMALPIAASAADDFTFALHGFVSVSGAYQDGSFFPSEGQQSLTSGNPVAGWAGNKSSLTFDVRQSRFNFSVAGPKVLAGATPKGVLEIDFFQGFGGGNYGDVSLLNRLRLAYTELNWGDHRLQFGQQNDLIFAMAPTSISHIAFPLGYATGNLGWRRPGVFGFHNFGVGGDNKLEIAWEVGRSQWADAAAAAGGGTVNTPSGISQAETSGTPALEGRVTFTMGKMLNLWVAGHYNETSLKPFGSTTAVSPSSITTTAFNGGAKFVWEGLTIMATGFTATNAGPLVGDFLQFNYAGQDIGSTGYWAQAGYNITKEFSLWGFYGGQSVDKNKAIAANMTKLENTTMNVQAMYRDGGMAFSLEWIQFTTKVRAAGSAAGTEKNQDSTQYMATATYFF